ncbi:MAG TPA: hypothetical protein VEH80_01465 [Candidatus Bathyarchaeia archaeon]|nr:hypothetical protein [Candidatus Bathyarchaeia archaeon]
MAPDRVSLQSRAMRGRGLGWKAERCLMPQSCELNLCIADDDGTFWHPADPLAFAKWRVRAALDEIPPHVLVHVTRGRDLIRRGMVWSAVGLGSAAALLGMVWSGQKVFSMKTLNGSGAYSPKAPRTT